MMWLFEHVASQCSRENAKTKAEFGLCILRLLFLYVKKKKDITNPPNAELFGGRVKNVK